MITSSPGFRPLAGVYEPSAITQLPDGRFLVVDDEKEHPLCLFSLGSDGHVADRTPVEQGLFDFNDSFWKLNDLEGLALGRSGEIYAITSLSLDGQGERKKSREKLVRFRIEGDRVVDPRSAKGLKDSLLGAHPVLAASAAIADVKGEGGLNVEALDLGADGQRLLVGFRSPLLDSRAIVACVENPQGIFENAEAPRVAPVLHTLDLQGHGIRGMSWVPGLAGHLVISGPVSGEAGQFCLWFWSGNATDPARLVTVSGVADLARAEGVSSAVIDGKSWIILVSDDGSRKEERCARYLLLDPAQLHIGD